MNLKFKFLFLILLALLINDQLKSHDLPDSVVKERIQAIQSMLDSENRTTKAWWYGWLITYGSATIVQSALYFNKNELAYHQDLALGAGTTLLGTFGQLIFPLPEGYSTNTLSNMPDETLEEKLVKLQTAERLLTECANWEKEGRSWKTHALYGTVNLGCGLIVWLGFKRSPAEGVVNFAANMAISELQIFTQPVRAIRDYKNYLSTNNRPESTLNCPPKISWSLYALPGGAGLRVQF
jgi:hypothetical protein